MKYQDVKISSVRLAPDATITKGRTWSGSPGFSIQIEYTLADGRTFPSHASTRKKKDLLAHVESEHRAAQNGELGASFDENGKFYGTVRSFWIGPARAPTAPPLPVSPVPVFGEPAAREFEPRDHNDAEGVETMADQG